VRGERSRLLSLPPCSSLKARASNKSRKTRPPSKVYRVFLIPKKRFEPFQELITMYKVPQAPPSGKSRRISSRAKCPTRTKCKPLLSPTALGFSVFGCDVCQNIGFASELERPMSWLCSDGSRVSLHLEKRPTGVYATLETPELTATLPATPFILASICRKIERRVLA
jgi:hypothetical protein